MVKTLSKCAAVLLLATGLASVGCAAAPAEPTSEEVATEAIDQALVYGKTPEFAATLDVRATYDESLHATRLDVTSNQLPPVDTLDHTGVLNPHDGDYFQTVKVYAEDAQHSKRVLATMSPRDYYGGKGIGPGGGCIHFDIPSLRPGEKIFVGAVVDLVEDTVGGRIAASPLVTVQAGTWDPEVFEFAGDNGH